MSIPTERESEATMPEQDQYEIRSVADFLKVPEGRIGDCLAEFADAIETHRATSALLIAVAAAQGNVIPAEAITMPYFIWIDDGARNSTVQFEHHVNESEDA